MALILLLTLVIAWSSYSLLPLIESYINPEALGEWIKKHGFGGISAFVLLSAIAAAIGLPRQLIALVAGYSFGLLVGLLLAISSISLGALLTFWFARFFARPWVQRRFPDAIKKIDNFIAEQPFLKILTIRFLPFGTNMLTNLAAGTTKLSATKFFSASFLGFLPQSALFVMAGNGFNINSNSQIILSVILLLFSALLALLIYKKHQHHPLR